VVIPSEPLRFSVFKKISPKKISDEIIEQFKDLLGKGELKPGDELPSERELAELIGVSRPALREALNALQAMEFIEIRPRSKIVVKSVAERLVEDPLSRLLEDDEERVFELLELRRAMESWSAYMAAERATGRDIQKLQTIIDRDQDLLQKGRDDATTDADFHVTVSMAAHNTMLSHLMATCYDLLWKTQALSRKRIFRNAENHQRIAEQHLKIFEAIRDRDPRRASREARQHIEFVEEELRSVFHEKERAEAR
jgi:GntR family transcriptional repressor for pyruvate dehydrogenase complex